MTCASPKSTRYFLHGSRLTGCRPLSSTLPLSQGHFSLFPALSSRQDLEPCAAHLLFELLNPEQLLLTMALAPHDEVTRSCSSLPETGHRQQMPGALGQPVTPKGDPR